MPHAVREHCNIFYEVTNGSDSSAERVLLIPGILSTQTVWGPVVRRLPGLQVITMDNRDSGRSSLAEAQYSIRDLAKDALVVMDDAGLASSHIAGHSMGGAIAMEMALLAPDRVRSLTLVNSWAKTDGYSGSVMRMIATLRDRLTDDREFLRTNTFVINAPALLRGTTLEDVAESILLYGPIQCAAASQRNIAAILPHDIADRLAAITCPTQIIWGTDDRIFPPWHARELLDGIAGARDIGIRGGGHMAILQSADRVAAAIVEMAAKRE